MPVALPALSLHCTIGSVLFTNSAVVPTIAKSFAHARISALSVSPALRRES
jgi:hypothetical protein